MIMIPILTHDADEQEACLNRIEMSVAGVNIVIVAVVEVVDMLEMSGMNKKIRNSKDNGCLGHV